jgi:DNA-binding MarR family transcriptional regulator
MNDNRTPDIATVNALAVLSAIATRLKHGKPTTITRLCEDTGLAHKTVLKAIGRLERTGAISVERSSNGANRYMVTTR